MIDDNEIKFINLPIKNLPNSHINITLLIEDKRKKKKLYH